jgi:MSHA biogenesis protein MshI
LFSSKATKISPITSGLTFFDDGIAFALVSHETQTPALMHNEFIPCSNAQQASVLANLSKQHNLELHPCNVVLQPHQYQILQTEKPDVGDDELAAALKWRIKDLIDYDVDDTVIEILARPSQVSSANTVEVVVSKYSIIESIVSLLKNANINLASIDISELAARNIGFYAGYDEMSYALLNLWHDYARISVYINGDLYLSRNSSIGLSTLEHIVESDDASLMILDSLALELQRTYDYYESHSRQAPINQLFVLLNTSSDSKVAELLEQRTGVNSQNMTISFLNTNDTETEILADPKCRLAIGGALRKEFE